MSDALWDALKGMLRLAKMADKLPEGERDAVLRFIRTHRFSAEKFIFGSIATWAGMDFGKWQAEYRAVSRFVNAQEDIGFFDRVNLRELMARAAELSNGEKTTVMILWARHGAVPGLHTPELIAELRREVWGRRGVPAAKAAVAELTTLYGEVKPLPEPTVAKATDYDWVKPVMGLWRELQDAAPGIGDDDPDKLRAKALNIGRFVVSHPAAIKLRETLGARL